MFYWIQLILYFRVEDLGNVVNEGIHKKNQDNRGIHVFNDLERSQVQRTDREIRDVLNMLLQSDVSPLSFIFIATLSVCYNNVYALSNYNCYIKDLPFVWKIIVNKYIFSFFPFMTPILISINSFSLHFVI